MAGKQVDSQRVQAIREKIDVFLTERLQTKLDKIKTDDTEGQKKERERFQPETWLASAAQRVNKIQMVTHALKYSHPDAKGTSILFHPDPNTDSSSVGTHCLNEMQTDIAVEDAKALDVNKFLCLEVDGKTFLELAIDKDPSFLKALSGDEQAALDWTESFAGITEDKRRPATTALASQVYFPVNDNAYHLLAPLFPTSLVHHVYERINQDRFSEESKAAREARKNGQWLAHGFREYPDLAIQRFGGANKQNISQLNSDRGGQVYLLPSVPPDWQSAAMKPPLHADSVFPRSFGYRRNVQRLTKALRTFLEKVQDYNNVTVRNKRAEMVSQIIDELVQYAAMVHELEPGWSQGPDCQLNEEERLWLDPGRSDFDEEFCRKYENGEWRTAVSGRFARWLNLRIEGRHTPMGDPEFLEWRREVEDML